MALTLDDLFASPDHYLHSFDGDAAVFVRMNRAAYNRSIFLDARISPTEAGSMRLPVEILAGRTGGRPEATGWIFHVAHCGSTLLARALDQQATNLVLREPLTLRQLALAPDRARLAITAAMLSKRYGTDAPTIIKANVPVNFLLPELIALDPTARAIFLHCTLRDYLCAILRSKEHRDWLRRVTIQLAPSLGDLSLLPDAERAAALWLAQVRAFANAIGRLPNARTLDAEVFFATPRRVLVLAARHLAVPMTEAAIEERVTGSLFATYSKNPDIAFDNDARLARRASLQRDLSGAFALAERWIERTTGERAPYAEAIRAASLTA